MSNTHRYILEKGSKKHLCPDCSKKTYVRYVNVDKGGYLPIEFGRCDRENKCNYHRLPPLETLCYFVQFDSLKDITNKAFVLVQGNNQQVIPKKAVFEQLESGVYLAEYFLKDKKNKSKTPLIINYSESNYKYFENYSNTSIVLSSNSNRTPQTTPEPVFFDFETFKQTLQPERYEKNTFIQNLFSRVNFPFEIDDVTKVVQLYRLGTVLNGYRAGANTFPYIDIKGNIRAIQVKEFNEQNHTTGTDFLHSIIEKHHTRNNKPLPEWLAAYLKQDKRITCLFGEQLLSKYPNNPVALVEAPKTAIYGTLYFGLPETPESLIWLAVYNKSSFTFDKLKVLKGRFVYVFPDLSKDGETFKQWQTKANEFESRLKATRFVLSDLLEQLAPERDKSEGNDIADYLIKLDWRPFRKRTIQEQPVKPEPEIVTKVTKVTHQQNNFFAPFEPLPKSEVFTPEPFNHQQWLSDLIELIEYFESITPPATPIRINEYTAINDLGKFVNTNIRTSWSYDGNAISLNCLKRLNDVKRFIEKNN